MRALFEMSVPVYLQRILSAGTQYLLSRCLFILHACFAFPHFRCALMSSDSLVLVTKTTTRKWHDNVNVEKKNKIREFFDGAIF